MYSFRFFEQAVSNMCSLVHFVNIWQLGCSIACNVDNLPTLYYTYWIVCLIGYGGIQAVDRHLRESTLQLDTWETLCNKSTSLLRGHPHTMSSSPSHLLLSSYSPLPPSNLVAMETPEMIQLWRRQGGTWAGSPTCMLVICSKIVCIAQIEQ